MSQRKSKVRRPSNVQEENDINLDEAIKECVRFIFNREGSKIPIKRSEIAKHLNTVCQTPPGHVNATIIAANKSLKQVYGYKLIQVEVKSGIQYILILNEESDSLEPSVMDANHKRILVATLTHIYMTGGPVKEEELWKFLYEAGLMEENDYAGRKLLTTTFTRQMYLQYTKVGEGDLSRNVFEWGQRAVEEIPKMFLLKKVADAFGKTPDYWNEQYKEASENNQES